MIIIIGNQKGGAGKSTLTLLLANYLTLSKQKNVTVIDMDYQQSIYQKYEQAAILENEAPYEVLSAGLEIYPQLLPVLKQNQGDIILIDLPGKLDDDHLIPVLNSAELMICPFAYDEFSFNSTIFFTLLVKNIHAEVPMVFVPNRIKGNVKYATKEQMETQLNNFGKVTQPIMDRVDFQRVNTFQTPLSVYPLISPVFEEIYKSVILPNLIKGV